MFVVGLAGRPTVGDFHHELYPEAKLLLHGHNPFPSPDDEIGGANLVWPPVAAYLVSPLTLLPASVADVVMVILGLACFAVSLWLVGVRDWRSTASSPSGREFVGEMRVSHLTPMMPPRRRGLARAGYGRLRGWRSGLRRVKFFLWPVAVWLAATPPSRDALVAAAVVSTSLLLVLQYTGLGAYLRSACPFSAGHSTRTATRCSG